MDSRPRRIADRVDSRPRRIAYRGPVSKRSEAHGQPRLMADGSHECSAAPARPIENRCSSVLSLSPIRGYIGTMWRGIQAFPNLATARNEKKKMHYFA